MLCEKKKLFEFFSSGLAVQFELTHSTREDAVLYQDIMTYFCQTKRNITWKWVVEVIITKKNTGITEFTACIIICLS